MFRKKPCSPWDEIRNTLILAPFVFIILYLVAWPTIRPAPQEHEIHQQ